MKTTKSTVQILLIGLLIGMQSCKSFVEIDPPKDQITSEKVYTSNETATAAIRGIYAQMMSESGFASGSIFSVTLLAGRSADEFINQNPEEDYIQFSTNNLLSENMYLKTGLWQQPYRSIYLANLVLENLQKATGVSLATRKQLEGEARFIRAFAHFYLVNLFGKIPVILSTDYRVNASAYQSSEENSYLQIIDDLKQAAELLSENYPAADRTRANKWAAKALLARVYLYHQDWINAEKEATEVIEKKSSYDLTTLDQVFLKNSQEAILQFFVPSYYGVNTYEGSLFILPEAPDALSQVTLSQSLLDAFEPGDLRKENWIKTETIGEKSWSYPFKYKIKIGASPLNEYSMVLRLAEQFLIRAEARAMQNNFEGTREDLNKIRSRAELDEIDFNTQPQLLAAIAQERRIELFAEWGHRWLDLKRTNRAEAVLGPVKSPNWQNTDVWYPIPKSELNNNKNLIQNTGY